MYKIAVATMHNYNIATSVHKFELHGMSMRVAVPCVA